VSHNGVNATLPTDVAPEQVTLEQAIELLDARAGKGAKKGKGGAVTGDAPRDRRTAPRRAKPATTPAAAAKKPKAGAKPVAKKKKAAK
jgi:DNA topoisomerase-1